MSEETFTASNGLTITPEADRLAMRIYLAIGGTIDQLFPAREVTALREYFQHERDQELGRWRDPEDPDWVVYPDLSTDWVLVLDEESGGTDSVFRQEPQPHEDNDFILAADRYFAAHPEPKPWEEAEPGEVWLVTIQNAAPQPAICGDDEFHFSNGYARIDSEAIVAGHCIWPVDGDDQ